MLYRALYCLALVPLAACTRDNPAFDDLVADASTASETGQSTGDGDGDGDGDDTNGTSDTGAVPDLPDEQLCTYAPSHGLDLRFGKLSADGCIDEPFYGRVLEANGGGVTIRRCQPGCLVNGCFEENYLLQTGPLLVAADHIPAQACVKVEVQTPLGINDENCRWGAITVLSSPAEGESAVIPYIIATSGSGLSTLSGQELLLNKIPDPVKSGACACAAVTEANSSCCEAAAEGPTFYCYPWTEPAKLCPGMTGSLEIPQAPDDVLYEFKVFQAQQLHSCNAPDLETSWAVVATF